MGQNRTKRIRKDLLMIENINIHKPYTGSKEINLRLFLDIPEGKYDLVFIPK